MALVSFAAGRSATLTWDARRTATASAASGLPGGSSQNPLSRPLSRLIDPPAPLVSTKSTVVPRSGLCKRGSAFGELPKETPRKHKTPQGEASADLLSARKPTRTFRLALMLSATDSSTSATVRLERQGVG